MSKKLAHEDYTVGWICPLEVEQIAAMEMLDEEHDRLRQPATDHNVYNLGSIAGHNVVIAGLHQPGNSPAATVVTQMRMTFPNLRLGMLVGIGGGVPVKTDNGMIRLGDIVVSKPVGGHSGAIQYDHGKAKDGQFERTGALAPPPAVLLNAAQDLAAKRARSRKDPVSDDIKRIDISFRGLQRYKYPGEAQDHLYKPDYIHRDSRLPCDDCGCDPSQRIQRASNADDEEPYIVVHRGTIASGELVVKDAELRDELAKEHGLLCFEMEAAGALADFPCIVIRGISDYCDSHKNDQWHGYAAAAAAAYARRLFFHMPIDEVKRYISETAEKAIHSAEKAIHSVKVRQDDQNRQEILDWLTPVNYGSQQSDFINRRQPGTGQWLLESEEFQTWLNSDQQTLFCPGIPGAGKTILTSIVVEELSSRFSRDPGVRIAYLYCEFRREHEQKAQDLLTSLLKQLSQERSTLPDSIKSLYDKHKKKRTRPSFDEISRTLQSVIGTYTRVIIIVDALDECQASDGCRKMFLSEISNLQTKTGANLFATSRFIPDIVEEFNGSMKLEIRAHDDDVQQYLNSRISQSPQKLLEAHREEITTQITKVVDGMFLLAQLHFESVKTKMTLKKIKDALKNLPTGPKAYDYAYEEAMKRILSQDTDYKDLAIQVLSWITCSRRPLSTSELQHALAVEVGKTELDEENLPQIEDMVSVCAGLVIEDEESSIIRLVHYTTQEYFQRMQHKLFSKAKNEITMTCITYLSFDTFKSGSCQSDEEFEQRLQLNKLYDYAAHYWGHHAREASTLCQGSLEFLQKQAQVEASSQALLAKKTYSSDTRYSERFPRDMTGLHLAAYFGLKALFQPLLATAQSHVDSKDGYGRTPLSWAAERGHEGIVMLLLATEKIDIDSKDSYSQTPLSWAAERGHEGVVKLLLATEKIDINSKGSYGRTPLSWAAEKGYEGIVKLLLATEKIDIDSKNDRYSRTPLSWAAQNGHEGVVKLLLATEKIDIDSKDDRYGRTPLSWAAENGHEGVVKLLLATEKININSKDDKYGRTPLSWAAENGHEGVVKLLLATEKIDINSKDDRYSRTPLSWAAEKGYEGIVKLLLATEKIDINSKNDKYSRTPLSWAAQNGHEGVVKLLLATEKIDIDSKDEYSRTPLSWAAQNGHEGVVKLLLATEKININSKDDKYGRTPLSWAAENGHKGVVKLLLATEKIDINSKDDRYSRTPLSWAAENGHEGVFKLLLATEKIDINSKNDKYSQTPLSWAAENGHEGVVKLLLATEKIDIDSKDEYSRTPLSWAAENGHKGVVKLLLATEKIDIDSKDEDGRTPLSWAAENGHEGVVKLLLATEKIDIDSKDDRYSRTPLSWAAQNGHEGVVKLLLPTGQVDVISDK